MNEENFKRISLIVSTSATLAFVGLVLWALADPTLLSGLQGQRVFWFGMILLGGAIPSFILSLFGQVANLSVTFRGVAFTAGGGYALAVFAVIFLQSSFFKPVDLANLRIIELVPEVAGAIFSEADIEDPEVKIYKIETKERHPLYAFHFPVGTTSVKLSLSCYIGPLPHAGVLNIPRAGKSVERVRYKLQKI